MTRDKHLTKVIFRRFKGRYGDVIALFPEEMGGMDYVNECQSYMHTGQHGAASIDVMRRTRPCVADEHKKLKAELEQIGYRLEIVHRFTRSHYLARKAAFDRIEEGSRPEGDAPLKPFSVLLMYPETLWAGREPETYFHHTAALDKSSAVRAVQDMAVEANEGDYDHEDFYPLLCVAGHVENEL